MPALRAYLRLMAAGEYWESHEVLEGPWRRSGDPFTQALILYASAWVHWGRGNAHGVQAQLAKTLDRLDGVAHVRCGVDVQALRRHAAQCRRVVLDGRADWRKRVSPLALDPPLAPAHRVVEVEAGVTSLDEARRSAASGAHHVVWYGDPLDGDVGPSAEAIESLVESVAVPVHVALGACTGDGARRPEGPLGRAAARAVAAGAAGVVVGAVGGSGPVDGATLRAIRARLPTSATLTCHVAVGEETELTAALADLAGHGVDRVASRGSGVTAWAGRSALAALCRLAGSRVEVVGAGGVEAEHAVALVDATGVAALRVGPPELPGVAAALAGEGLLADSPTDAGSSPRAAYDPPGRGGGTP